MSIEAGFGSLGLVFLLAIARQRDETYVQRRCALTQTLRDFIAVDVGQTDVDDRNIGFGMPRDLESAVAVRGFEHRMALERQRRSEHLAHVVVIVYEKYAARLRKCHRSG